jgi:hypothetical protein
VAANAFFTDLEEGSVRRGSVRAIANHISSVPTSMEATTTRASNLNPRSIAITESQMAQPRDEVGANGDGISVEMVQHVPSRASNVGYRRLV